MDTLRMLNILLCLAYALLCWYCWPRSSLSGRHNWYLVSLSCVALLVLWRLRAGIYPGLDLHFVGLTVITLMYGWRGALVIGALPQLILLLVGVDDWGHAAALFWLGVGLPVMASFAWLTLCHNLLPKNLWIYVFVGGFFNGALAFSLRAMGLGVWFSGEYDWQLVVDNYLALIPLFFFAEGMLNGFPTTMMVVYRPQWLATWNEQRYLQKS